MKVIITTGNSGKYLPDALVLARVYPNQSDDPPEKEQIAGDVLFRPSMKMKHKHLTAWLPRGLAHGIAVSLEKMRGDFTVQVANELPFTVGVLNYCPENFEAALRLELDKRKIPYEVQ